MGVFWLGRRATWPNNSTDRNRKGRRLVLNDVGCGVVQGEIMFTRNAYFAMVVSGIALCGLCLPARGQAVYTGQTAFQNLGASQSEQHRPGTMVVSGLVRAQAAVRYPAAPFEITETTPPISYAEEARIQVLTVALEELLETFNFILVRYLQREGFDVTLPDDSDSSSDGGTSDGDTSDGRDSNRGDSTSDGGKGQGRKSLLVPSRVWAPEPF